MIFAKCKFHIASHSNLMRILHRLRQFAENLPHFLLALEIELIVGKPHTVFVIDVRRGLDAQKNIVRFRIFPVHVVNIVSADHWDPCFSAEADQFRIDERFLIKPLILNLEVEIIFAENISQFERFCLRALIITVEQAALHLPRQTCRQRNDAVAVLPQQFFIHARFVVKPLCKSSGDDFNQVPVTVVVLRQQNQMPLIFILVRLFVLHPPRSRVYLAADNRMNSLFFAFPPEINDAEHDAVIRNGQRIHSQFLRPRHNVPDPGSAVQKTVFRMYMKMCK